MRDLIRLIFGLVVDPFRSRSALEAEVLVLRQQINVNPTDLHGHGQGDAELDLLAVSEQPQRPRRRTTGDRYALASRGFSILLALEVESAAGTSGGAGGDPPVDP